MDSIRPEKGERISGAAGMILPHCVCLFLSWSGGCGVRTPPARQRRSGAHARDRFIACSL